MNVNGVEFAFDANKLSDLDRHEKAMDKLAPELDKAKALLEQNKFASATRVYLKAFKAFFDEVAGVDVLGDTEDSGLCMACFEDFNLQMAEQKKLTRENYFAKKKKGRK